MPLVVLLQQPLPVYMTLHSQQTLYALQTACTLIYSGVGTGGGAGGKSPPVFRRRGASHSSATVGVAKIIGYVHFNLAFALPET